MDDEMDEGWAAIENDFAFEKHGATDDDYVNIKVTESESSYMMDEVDRLAMRQLSFYTHEPLDFSARRNELLYYLEVMGLEVVLQIFANLSYTDLAAASLVSKSFYTYANHSVLPQWRHLRLFPHRRKITEKVLLGIVKRCTMIRSLSLKYCKLINNTEVLSMLLDEEDFRNNLEVLDLSGSLIEEKNLLEFTKKLLNLCPNLVMVDFSWTKLKKAENIQNLLLHENKRQRSVKPHISRKKLLSLRFSSNLHIKSGQKMLLEMNVKIEFIEKRDNALKVQFTLAPYREDDISLSLPRLKLSSGLKAKAALPLWKVSLFVCSRLELGNGEIEKVTLKRHMSH